MRHPSIIIHGGIVATVTALALAGCATPIPGSGPTNSAGTTAEPILSTGPGAPEPTSSVQSYMVTYEWAVPSTQVSVTNRDDDPLPGPIPLPYLAGIYVGDHPEGSPAYQRMSFYFRGGLPSYTLQYVPTVLQEATGEPVSVQGNALLRVGFINAQAHDAGGSSTITAQPPATIGFDTLQAYGFAGDFEGHVTYALGLHVAPGSDQAVPIRAGQLTKPDGSGGAFYVVFVDVRRA